MKNIKLSFENKTAPQKGKVLISDPFLVDAYFKRTVVLITENNETEGSVGFILNKATDLKFNEIVSDAPFYNGLIYMGGPVGKDQLYYIHTLGDLISDSIKIKNDLYWGGNFNDVLRLLEDGKLLENQIKFFVGYSGWTAGQLDAEIKENTWAVATLDFKQMMNDLNHNMFWQHCVKLLGKEYEHMAHFPPDHSLN